MSLINPPFNVGSRACKCIAGKSLPTPKTKFPNGWLRPAFPFIDSVYLQVRTAQLDLPLDLPFRIRFYSPASASGYSSTIFRALSIPLGMSTARRSRDHTRTRLWESPQPGASTEFDHCTVQSNTRNLQWCSRQTASARRR